MAVWSEVNLRIAAQASRFDPEYFQPHFLEAEALLARINEYIVPLGDLVVDGYRVVYENTEILSDPFNPDYHVKYLQAANISSRFPSIRIKDIGWVDRTDWERYEKGRVRHGELLIEVKGKAEKVILVPNDFPVECLVSGTLYKMLLNESRVNTSYILIYLLSKFGRYFRDRSKSNILVPYVNKDELYAIPIPIASPEFQISIAQDYMKAEAKYRESEILYAKAETLLLEAIGLDNLDSTYPITYEYTFSEVVYADRFDAEYFSPRAQRALEIMRRSGKTLNDVSQLVKRQFKPKQGKKFNYIEIGDLGGEGQADSSTIDGEEAPSRAQWIVRSGDIITSTVRPIRRLSALIEPEQEGFVCSSGFAVLQPTGVVPEILLVYLRTPIVCEILDLYTTATMYPAIATDLLLDIPFSTPTPNITKQIVESVRASRQAREEAQRILEKAKVRVEKFIEEGQ